MFQSSKKRTSIKSLGQTPGSQALIGEPKRGWTGFIIVSLIIVLILAIVFVSLYINAAPFRRTVIKVDDITINFILHQ